MSNKSGSVSFMYGNAFGRFILKTIMKLHLDRIAVCFLRSRLSKPMVKGYVKRNGIDVTDEQINHSSHTEKCLSAQENLYL